MIIWTGLGILWPLAAIIGPVVIMIIAEKMGIDLTATETKTWGIPLLCWSAFGTALLFSSTLGRTRKRIFLDPTSRQRVTVKSSHTVFFIPLRYYTILLGLICLFCTFVFATGNERLSRIDRGGPEGNHEQTSPGSLSQEESYEELSTKPISDRENSSDDDLISAAPDPDGPINPNTPVGAEDQNHQPLKSSTDAFTKTQWTDDQGRKMTAVFLGTEGDPPIEVRFNKADEKECTFPLERLSAEDRMIVLETIKD
ncbi:MAG: hypothetical protein AAF357_00180 [Verrucomicrobiota bacterium]